MGNSIEMYSIWDKDSLRWDTPFFARSDLFAKRHFHIISTKQGTMINEFLSSFELFHIGSFDLELGNFTTEMYSVKHGSHLKKELEHQMTLQEAIDIKKEIDTLNSHKETK